jgi:hypothetical protein
MRSASGAILMLAIIPIFAGLLACMPVPIGNPEKSRIDPEISGVWFLGLEDELNGLYHFQPFDKRAWILTGVPLEEGPDYEGEPFDLESAEDAIAVLEAFGVGDDGVTATETIIYKAWLTKLAGQTFMTWEVATAFDDEGEYDAEVWLVFRVDKVSTDQVNLYLVNGEHDVFDDRKEPVAGRRAHEYPAAVRRDWERALKKVARNVDDDDLYSEVPWELRRVPPELTGEAAELFQEVMSFD